MLNYFYWYSILTSAITILYLIPVSSFNSKLDSLFFIMIFISIIVSFLLGKIYNKNFRYKNLEYKKNNKEFIPIFIIILISIVEFLIVGDIPLLSVTFKHINTYKDFETIPFLHMFLAMISLYYSIVYFYRK